MKNLKISLLIAVFLAFGFALSASAHNPRLIAKENPTLEKPIEISGPDVSQAFYGQLSGAAEYYRFQITEKQDFYFQILVPEIADASKDFSIDLNSENGELLAVLDSQQSDWPIFHEKFANDNYFAGPEKTIELNPGNYLLKVYNKNNQEKYTLVVGIKELWTVKEMYQTTISLPALKIFAEKSPFTAYFNYVGLGLGITIILITGLVFLGKFVYRKIKYRTKKL